MAEEVPAHDHVRVPSDVGWTGLMTAHMRAVESARDDRLFTDPLATALVGMLQDTVRTGRDAVLPTGPADLTGELTETWYMLSTYLGVRTGYYDQVVRAAVDDGVRQVVLLAAGLDARAFRLGLPVDTAVFEVDTAPVLRFKDRVVAEAGLSPTVRRTTVAADLRGPWHEALTQAGLDPSLRTLWLVEGLFMYLSPQDCDGLLERLTALSGPGSRIALEYYEDNPRLADAGVADAVEGAVIDRVLSFFQPGPPLPPGPWLAGHGWTAEVTTLAAETTAAGRRTPLMFRRGRPHEVNLWLASGSLGDQGAGGRGTA
ncbi:S-adenosyl-L-methionine-dependent methyltransferase [Streptomyces sulfonofaciens]|uniref:S-adenosyl-L-methionine-dependent methyltransferase n=1 Tax=Streptomyces sulfonofaciens TaxID=68272 RepID=A0A919GF31_9ACTN|nr:SAM-dependent methyltransferase [Streptomyces sulfonofaciens]GHH83390.1 S-adenosyl-L-methionine-dependent methyltransferase [Streptomyces sulfonofaciens]